ncbi:hypothetical protein [Ruminococcus sp.]|uniref:hypothetical protein n=1 Tax=Ruminococcus sp. TaxID=41978 RepID=UPI0025DBDDD6|nr:hypothetical protein [Ruminococcus sp.]
MKNRKNYLKRRAKLRRLTNEGFAFETSTECEYCGERLYDFPLYDAKGCLKCGNWAEDVCGDPKCPCAAEDLPRPLAYILRQGRMQAALLCARGACRITTSTRRTGLQKGRKNVCCTIN